MMTKLDCLLTIAHESSSKNEKHSGYLRKRNIAWKWDFRASEPRPEPLPFSYYRFIIMKSVKIPGSRISEQ